MQVGSIQDSRRYQGSFVARKLGRKRKLVLSLQMCHSRGEREALLARREFLQQLSLWEEDIKVPLPGGNGGALDEHFIFSEECYQN